VDATGARYWAFISYSHRDAKVASAVQRALETYRIPKRLVGTSTKVGEIPAALKPIFRDRDEMPSGADLKATVREALFASRYLIVVCSPDAACSQWVNQEIIEFKKLHGGSGVLALIAAGEPFASNIPGREVEECFPPALRYALDAGGEPKGEALEPIAADLRPQGDRKRLAILKLIAGMIGVGVDELVRRDAQRRARRLAYVATGAVAGMAVMAVLTVLAVQSRAEAQSQRAQAEDLIEFMLGDLRKRLEPVGGLDVLDSVGEKALAYYARQNPDQLDAAALGRRSRALHFFGEMREQRGKLDEALTAFNAAADTTAELLARQPNDGQRIFDHAQSVYWVGYIAWRRGQAKAAEDAFLRYRELAKQLVQIDPGNIDWQLESASATHNLGVVQLDSLRLNEALRSFETEKSVMSRLLRSRPSIALDLADVHGWVAKTLEASNDYRGAMAAQQERLRVLDAIAGSARDRRVRQQIANAEYELGRLDLDLGSVKSAENHARTATTQADQLALADQSNMFWLSESCFDRLLLAEIESFTGKGEMTHEEIENAMVRISRLIASDRTAMNWQVKLLGRALAIKASLALMEHRPFPTEDLERYIGTAKQFMAAGKRLNADQIGVVAIVELALGDLYSREGRIDAAADHWRASIARLEPFTSQASHAALTALARANLRLGNLELARTITAQIQASNYRHPAYASLVAELSRAAGRGQQDFKSGRT
jgi:hypothetical protein